MRYLIQLVTPSNGCLIDIFMGSGSTGVAAAEVGGLKFFGIEKDKEYYEISKARVRNAYLKSGRKRKLA